MSDSSGSGPRNVVEASGKVASDVVSGLVGTPALLSIVVLNVVAMGVACWFLAKLADATQARTERMMQMIADCMRERHST
jgi:type IV secretory pathway TrbD component